MLTLKTETMNRDRTFADRKAFLLSESERAFAEQILAEQVQKEQERRKGPKIEMPPPTARDVTRRMLPILRESLSKARKLAFGQVIGEAVFQALPFDDDEKEMYHSSIVKQTIDAISSLKEAGWDIKEPAKEIAEGIKELTSFDITNEAYNTPEKISEAVLNAVDLKLFKVDIMEIANAISERVIDAVVETKCQTKRQEAEIKKITECEDTELSKARISRLERRPPTLLESLYEATLHTLDETTAEEMDKDLLLAEAITQYALLETLSAIGLVNYGGVDNIQQALAIINRKK
jgi:hypothetical protein